MTAEDLKTSLLPATPAASVTHPSSIKRYFGSGLKIAIALSFSLLFLLLTGPFGHPFAGNVEHLLLASLFFISNFISLFYYLAQVHKRMDEIKQRKQKWILLFISLMTLMGLGLAIAITTTTALTLSGIINAAFFVLFSGGLFLSFACRLIPENKNSGEKYAIYVTTAICVLIAILVFSISNLSVHLPELGSLSKYTILGVNVFINILFNIIGLISYFGKIWDYARFRRTNNASVKKRLWEHKLSIIGVSLGSILFCCILALRINPFGGGFLVTMSAGIMAWSAIASICSKVGRCIDEAEVTPKPRTTWFSRIAQYPTAASFARRTAALGLLVLLGFTLAVMNKVFIPPWGLNSPLFIFAIFTMAFSVLAHWLLEPSSNHALNIPPYQIHNQIFQAVQILKALKVEEDSAVKTMLADALFTPIQQAAKLLNSEWRNSFTAKFPHERNLDDAYQTLNNCLSAESFSSHVINNQHTLKENIFKPLAKAQFHLAYRPALTNSSRFLLILSLIAWIGCTLSAFYTVTGALTVHIMTPLTIAFGLAAWGTTYYLSNKLPGGPYAVWAAIFGIIGLVSTTLSIAIGLSSMTTGIILAIATVIMLLASFLSYQKAYYYNNARDNGAEIKFIQRTQKFLTIAKFFFGITFIIGAFLSPKLLSSWDPLGGFSFFAMFGFFAIESFRSGLKSTPANIEAAINHQNDATLILLITKCVLTIAAILFILKPSLFPFSISDINLTPIFLLVGVMMPLFSGKPIRFKLAKSGEYNMTVKEKIFSLLNMLSDMFNTYVGVKPLMDKYGKTETGLTLIRELAVFTCLLILPATLIILATGAPIATALPAAGAGITITLLYRWGTMAHRARQNPTTFAEDYLYAKGTCSENGLPIHDMLNAPYLSSAGAILIPECRQNDANASVSRTASQTSLHFLAGSTPPRSPSPSASDTLDNPCSIYTTTTVSA